MKINVPIIPDTIRFCTHCSDFQDSPDATSCTSCGKPTVFVQEAFFEQAQILTVVWDKTAQNHSGQSMVLYDFNENPIDQALN